MEEILYWYKNTPKDYFAGIKALEQTQCNSSTIFLLSVKEHAANWNLLWSEMAKIISRCFCWKEDADANDIVYLFKRRGFLHSYRSKFCKVISTEELTKERRERLLLKLDAWEREIIAMNFLINFHQKKYKLHIA